MNKLLKNVIAIVLIVSVVYFGNKSVQTYLGKQAVNEISFEIYTLEQAKKIAEEQGKLVLADYSAIWCPSCRKLDTQVFANKNVASSIESRFVYTRIDYDTEDGKVFAKQHGLVGFPRVLVLNTQGMKLTEMPLSFDPAEYVVNLNKVTQTFLAN